MNSREKPSMGIVDELVSDKKDKEEPKKRMTPDEFVNFIVRLLSDKEVRTITINKNEKGHITYVGHSKFKKGIKKGR
jgi:hypothetical protein